MGNKSIARWSFLPLCALLFGAGWSFGQPAAPELSKAQAQALVQQALAHEIDRASNAGRPMRYRLRKITPRLTTTKKIIETTDGDVARLISVNGKPLSTAAEQREMARLDSLLASQADQDHRKQSEDTDTARAMKILRALPKALVFTYTGPGTSPVGPVETYTFAPKHGYSPSGMETQILTVMTGKITVDPFAQRVVHLEGHLDHDISYGWGIIGRLNKGGWIAIDQAPVADSQWRTVRLQLAMTGRILFFTKTYDTLQEQSDYEPVSTGLDYREAIGMLKKDP
ncbi:MAG TPA: hypothetical protein VGS10_16145 [Terracidiphilus sp.]|nr:hypothetical protein [Terracidiphilus sp.]